MPKEQMYLDDALTWANTVGVPLQNLARAVLVRVGLGGNDYNNINNINANDTYKLRHRLVTFVEKKLQKLTTDKQN